MALNEQDEVEKSYQEGSLLLLPRIINSSSIIKEAFRYGLPVLCYKHASYIHLLDTSCGMMINYTNDHKAVSEFAQLLESLNYDPDAIQILKKGAKNRYQEKFSWGMRVGGT